MTELGRFGVALGANEIALTAAVSTRHRSLLASYRLNAHRGEKAARERILADMCNLIELGALDRASDLLIVLAMFMTEASQRERRLALATSRQRAAICLQRGRGAARPAHLPAKLSEPPFKAIHTHQPVGDPAPQPTVGEADDVDRPC